MIRVASNNGAKANDRRKFAALAEFLRDPAPEVRRAANEALLWDSERRWAWIRPAVRIAMSEPAQIKDGPLLLNGPPLPPGEYEVRYRVRKYL